MYCCIRSCPSRYGKDAVSFHRFPQKNKVRRDLWVEACGRGNEINYDYALVCSRHFLGGRPARMSDCEAENWVPTLLLDRELDDETCAQKKRSTGHVEYDEPVQEIEEHEASANEIRCVVRGCGLTKEGNPTMIFFHIPKNKDPRRKWLMQIGMHGHKMIMSYVTLSAVCELHFELSQDLQNYDEVITLGRRAVLKEHIMPTRNIPQVLGHNVARFTYELDPNVGTSAAGSPKKKRLRSSAGYNQDGGCENPNPYPQAAIPYTAGDGVTAGYDENQLLAEIDEEFVNVCRCCLSTDRSSLISVFDDNIVDIFFQFTSIAINPDEPISILICQECRTKLLEQHFFRDTCITNTQILLHRHEQSQTLGKGTLAAFTNGDESIDSSFQHNRLHQHPLRDLDYDDDDDDGGDDNENSRNGGNETDNGDSSNSGYKMRTRGRNSYQGLADDPEGLLMPQKEQPENKSNPTPKVPVINKKVGALEGSSSRPKSPMMKKKYVCNFCRKDYSSKNGFEMHLDTHKGQDPSEFTVSCPHCPVMRRRGEPHRCYIDNVSCHICDENFRAWSYLKIHLAKKHHIKAKRHEMMITTRKVYLQPNQEVSQDEARRRSGTPDDRPVYKCGFCKSMFRVESGRDIHEQEKHHPVELIQCSICLEQFSCFRKLEKHHDQHVDQDSTAANGESSIENSENKKCEHCGKQFNRYQTLLLHLQYVHRDQNVVECGSCSTLFSHPIQLAKHDCDQEAQVEPKEKESTTNSDLPYESDPPANNPEGFVIVQPESILRGISNDKPPTTQGNDAAVPPATMAKMSLGSSLAGAGGTMTNSPASQRLLPSETHTDPLLGVGDDEVISIDSDDEDDSTANGAAASQKPAEEIKQEPNSNSFNCSVCGKSFDKLDILDRHMKLHRMMNAARRT